MLDLAGEAEWTSILGGGTGKESVELCRIDELSLNGALVVFCCNGNPYDTERSYRPRGDSKAKVSYGDCGTGDGGLESFLEEKSP